MVTFNEVRRVLLCAKGRLGSLTPACLPPAHITPQERLTRAAGCSWAAQRRSGARHPAPLRPTNFLRRDTSEAQCPARPGLRPTPGPRLTVRLQLCQRRGRCSTARFLHAARWSLPRVTARRRRAAMMAKRATGRGRTRRGCEGSLLYMSGDVAERERWSATDPAGLFRAGHVVKMCAPMVRYSK